VTSWLAHYGVATVFVLLLIDAVFPAASELVMVYAGALASGALAHKVDVLGWHGTGFGAYVAVVVAGVIGYQLGSIVGWWIGYRGGRAFVDRYGRFFHLSLHQVDRAERWFERWRGWAVLVGRVTPVARSFVSIPAGLFQTPFPRYNVLTFLGNLVWCLALAAVGWALGSSWDTFHHDFRWVEYLVVAAIVAALVYLLWRRRRTATLSPREDSAR
jgi:membrane protein DedA with SNARE-associated domain